MSTGKIYDVVITGGGLAGLALSIRLADRGYSVVLVEKEQYPLHRVCGEYISRESWDYLLSLGVDLVSFNLPQISRLELSTTTGRRLNQPLPLGGFGISRYLLDATLASIARKKGVEVLENTRTTSINHDGKLFHTGTAAQVFVSRLACAGFGKRSNLDLNWERPFVSKTRNPLNNYIGVKYHVRGDFRKDT
ncbi:MAG: FAD-binding protein, partial [Chitinophagaceae bacterium]